MKLNEFIFSEKVPIRLCRHFFYWSFVFVFCFLGISSTYFTIPAHSATLSFSVLSIVNDLKVANLSPYLSYTVNNFVVLVAYCCAVAYWLLPRYLMKKRYMAFVSWLIVLTLITEIIRIYYSGFMTLLGTDELDFILWFGGISFVNAGAPIYCGLFITIKMLKTWYIEETAKSTLI